MVKEDASDGIKIESYFVCHRQQILDVLKENKQSMLILAKRKGSVSGDPIVDSNERLRPQLTKLSAHYLQNEDLDDKKHVTFLAGLFNRIRNNVFHGGKIYDDKEDIALLTVITPLLQEILWRCEPLDRNTRVPDL